MKKSIINYLLLPSIALTVFGLIIQLQSDKHLLLIYGVIGVVISIFALIYTSKKEKNLK
jgi:drug/metabolite transporter superfamily protein YnfA